MGSASNDMSSGCTWFAVPSQSQWSPKSPALRCQKCQHLVGRKLESQSFRFCHFGLSNYVPATLDRSFLISEFKGTRAYADPTFVETKIYTKESDVYSFGVVLFEVLCSRLSVDLRCEAAQRSLLNWVKNSSKEEIRDKIIDSNLRQQMEHHSFDMFLKLALQCVEREPTRRPSILDLIMKTLESAIKCQGKRRFSKIKRASGFLLGVAVATVLL